ncbi:MAG: lysophospholipase [Burkholderiaceae bacterium]|nr:lysophospholipase [Burkholderiaceae bacterium]
MQSQERTLTAGDGCTLFVTDWRPEAPAASRRGVLLMHGLGEHCGRYRHVAQFFNDQGYLVRGYDHRGHGRSGGARGDIPEGEALLRDAQMVLDDFAAGLDGPPILLGHSMGGLIAARFAVEKRAPLSGLILSSPALAIGLSGGQKLLLKVVSAIAPGLTLPNGLEQRYLSHDANVVQAYAKDPLVHPKISARLLNFMLDSIAMVHANAAELPLPMLLVYAGDDHLVDPGGSAALAKVLPSGAVVKVYERLYHEIFNELDAAPVFEDMRAWLSQH